MPRRPRMTIQLTRIMLLSPIFLALGALVSAILNSQQPLRRRRLGARDLQPGHHRGGVRCLAPTMGMTASALGVVIGSFLHFAVQLPLLRRRFTTTRASMRSDDRRAQGALALMVPRAIGLGVTQITFVVNTTLATALGLGGR